MLVGPLPWKKSGRETWQKVSMGNGMGEEGLRKGGRREGSKLQSGNHLFTHKMVKSTCLKWLLLLDLTHRHTGPTDLFKTSCQWAKGTADHELWLFTLQVII